MEELTQEIQSLKKAKRPSGHVAAGRKWDTSERGRVWKQQTIKAKHALRDIIKRRTGIDTFANQRMALKYAGFLRDGKTADAKRIVDQVVATAKKVDAVRGKTRKIRKVPLSRQGRNSAENKVEKTVEESQVVSGVPTQSTKIQGEGLKENSAGKFGTATFQQNQEPTTPFSIQPKIQQPFQNSAENSANKSNSMPIQSPTDEIEQTYESQQLDRIQLPDLLD
jgi:hypothetical protein